MKEVKIKDEKIVTFYSLFNEMTSSTVVWEKDMPMYVLFIGAGCSASSNVALGGRMVQIIQKYCYLKENKEGVSIFAKWNRGETTLETLISKYENEIDNVKLTQFIEKREEKLTKQYEYENSKKKLLDTLPESIKQDIEKDYGKKINTLSYKELENIWGEYSELLLSDLKYGFWMQEYSLESEKIQELIEEFIENKTPAFEYYLLADLINQGMFYNVFTTNFDNFMHEAMNFLGTRARVCIYDDKASSISYNRKKPNIIKLHGEYLYNNTRNYINETQDLGKALNCKFKEALQKFGMIIVGYQGNDYSIMKVLEELKKERPYPLYWCVKESDLNKISWRVVELVNNTPKSFIVIIKDFRTFVVDLWEYWSLTSESGESSIQNIVDKAESIRQELTKVIREKAKEKSVESVCEAGIPFEEYFVDEVTLQKSPFMINRNEIINSFNMIYDTSSSNNLANARALMSSFPLYKQRVTECILELLADHVYLTTKQLYFLLFYRNVYYGDKDALYSLLKRLKENKIVALYRFKSCERDKESLSIVSLDFAGAKLYQGKHKKNANWTSSTVNSTTVFDVKRILVANQCITEMLRWTGVLFEIRPKLNCNKIDGHNGVRPSAKLYISTYEEEYCILFESIRRLLDWENDLKNKLERYNSFYSVFNERKKLILILCGEDLEHTKDIYEVFKEYLFEMVESFNESRINYDNVWFTFDRNLLNDKQEKSYFKVSSDEMQYYAEEMNFKKFITREIREVVPSAIFSNKYLITDEKNNLIHLFKTFLMSINADKHIVDYAMLMQFVQYMEKKDLTLQEFGYYKLLDLLNDLDDYYYKFYIGGDNLNSLIYILAVTEDNMKRYKLYVENEIAKKELEDLISLIFFKSQQGPYIIHELENEYEGEYFIKKDNLKDILSALTDIFNIYQIGDETCIELSWNKGQMNKNKENLSEWLKLKLQKDAHGIKLIPLNNYIESIRREIEELKAFNFSVPEKALQWCRDEFDIYEFSDGLKLIQVHQKYLENTLNDINKQDKYELQIYKENMFSKIMNLFGEEKRIEPEITNIKQLITIIAEIIYMYDCKKMRIELSSLEHLLVQKHIDIQKYGFNNLEGFLKEVHNTIHVYEYDNTKYVKVNIYDEESNKKRPKRKFNFNKKTNKVK